MSDQPPSLFGWDLLYSSVEQDIHNNQDVLVCFVHLVLVSSGFKCIGIGESKTLDGTETRTEALPRGWNDGYAIRYVYQGKLYNLKGTPLSDGIIINLVRMDERTVSMIQLNTRLLAQTYGSLDQMIPENSTVNEIIKANLIDKVIVSTKTKESSSQTPQKQTQPATRYPSADGIPSRLMEPQRQPVGGIGIGPYGPPGGFAPVGVGSVDLNPFGINPLGLPRPDVGIGGGGMLFVPPMHPGMGMPPGNLGIPPGSLPPGARFDPFRPPDADRFPQPRRPSNPDNDEMPPPGFENMFM